MLYQRNYITVTFIIISMVVLTFFLYVSLDRLVTVDGVRYVSVDEIVQHDHIVLDAKESLIQIKLDKSIMGSGYQYASTGEGHFVIYSEEEDFYVRYFIYEEPLSNNPKFEAITYGHDHFVYREVRDENVIFDKYLIELTVKKPLGN